MSTCPYRAPMRKMAGRQEKSQKPSGRAPGACAVEKKNPVAEGKDMVSDSHTCAVSHAHLHSQEHVHTCMHSHKHRIVCTVTNLKYESKSKLPI